MKNLKHFLLTILLFISVLYTQAQTYVTIPDANFRAALQAQISGCFNANGQLNINCGNINNLTSLNIDYQNIQDLTGIEYLTSLDQLNCIGNALTFLPTLPNSITYLDCRNNQIASMVNVPSLLQSLYLTDNQLTTLPTLAGSLYFADVSRNNITTLPTLPSSLNQLNCSNNNLTTIPALPANINFVICDSNNISTFPTLPMYISGFSCAHNPVSTLPTLPHFLGGLNIAYTSITSLSLTNLPQFSSLDVSGNPNLVMPAIPSTTTAFYCDYSNLTSLPPLPNTLQILHCAYNNLTAIGLSVYTSLYDIDISGNPLSVIPIFPSNAHTIGIADLNLTSLPPLPNSVYSLNCSHNNLLALPINTNFDKLDCSHNNLTSLAGIQYVYDINCSYNQITYIPLLNSASFVNVSNNPLACLPTLSDSLMSLDISNTFISCIPNNPNSLPNLASQLGLPLCSGTNGVCQPANISGKAYFDMNNNAVLDAGEGSISYFYVIATHPQMGTYTAFSDANGNYSLDVSPATGNYNVSLNSYSYLPSYYTINPTNPYSVSVPSAGSAATNNDFYAYTPPVNDLSVQLYAQTARPGFDRHFYIYPSNYGTTSQNATITFTFDANYSFVSSSIAPTSQNGNLLTFNIANFAPFYTGNYYSPIEVTLNLDITTPLGITVNHSCSIDPIAGDATPLNNTDVLAQVTINAVDPNLKNVNHKVLSPQQVLAATPLAYHIEFQNTGTDTAYTVVVRDTLSENVEVGSLEMVGASNPFSLSIEDNHILIWTFLNIMLVDSNTNEPASHGFINYRIKPKTTLQIGDEIQNTAHIYFDYNDAVVTNTAVTKVEYAQKIALATDVKVLISPNPVRDNLQIKVNGISSKWLEMNILDAQGKVILTEKASNFSEEWTKKVEVSSWAKGIYLLQIRTEKGISMEKISVE